MALPPVSAASQLVPPLAAQWVSRPSPSAMPYGDNSRGEGLLAGPSSSFRASTREPVQGLCPRAGDRNDRVASLGTPSRRAVNRQWLPQALGWAASGGMPAVLPVLQKPCGLVPEMWDPTQGHQLR